MKFVLASQNKHKLVEMQSILSAHGVEVPGQIPSASMVSPLGKIQAIQLVKCAVRVFAPRIFSSSSRYRPTSSSSGPP